MWRQLWAGVPARRPRAHWSRRVRTVDKQHFPRLTLWIPLGAAARQHNAPAVAARRGVVSRRRRGGVHWRGGGSGVPSSGLGLRVRAADEVAQNTALIAEILEQQRAVPTEANGDRTQTQSVRRLLHSTGGSGSGGSVQSAANRTRRRSGCTNSSPRVAPKPQPSNARVERIICNARPPIDANNEPRQGGDFSARVHDAPQRRAARGDP